MKNATTIAAKQLPMKQGTALALVSGILYSSLGYLGVSQLGPNFTIYDMLFWRFFVSALLLIPFVLKGSCWTPLVFKVVPWLFVVGGASYGLSSVFYFLAEIGRAHV